MASCPWGSTSISDSQVASEHGDLKQLQAYFWELPDLDWHLYLIQF